MSAVETLREARAVGIHLEVEGEDLLLEASAPPPTAVLDALSQHKTEIVAILRRGHDCWSSEDWRLFFKERAEMASCRRSAARRGRGSGVRVLHHRMAKSKPVSFCTWPLRFVRTFRKPRRCRLAVRNRTGNPHLAAFLLLDSGRKCVDLRRRMLSTG